MEAWTKHHACMMARSIMSVYSRHPFYITLANFCMVDVHLPKHQEVVEAANAREEIVQIKDKRFLYSSLTKATSTESSVNAIH